MSDYISRVDAIEALYKMGKSKTAFGELLAIGWVDIKECLEALPSADAVHGWIPCSEKMPKELERVNVTWLNHNPPFYYQNINVKDEDFCSWGERREE